MRIICKALCVFSIFLLFFNYGNCQMVQFGVCPNFQTMDYFDLERFLGKWYVIQRYPIWYEGEGQCAYKTIEACGRHIEIEHGFVTNNIRYILQLNSSYTPGDQAVFPVQQNSIDPVGVPLSVITTDYSEYALIYGCRLNNLIGIKFSVAWILSREQYLSEETIQLLRDQLNNIPFNSPTFLEQVNHDVEKCRNYWTAYVPATSLNKN